MRVRTFAFAFALLTFVAREVAADDQDDEEVIVRGRQQAAGFVSRRSVDDSPREITDAASLIEGAPGVHVRRLGADDSFSTLSIRGSSSTQVSVYLAGVPLSGGADPTLDLATLPIWPGAEVRVHRTFAPAALGRGSLGGTLVLDPPSAHTPNRTEIWDAVGSYGAMRVRVGDVRGDPDGVRIVTGLSASRSVDDFTYLDPTATGAANHDVYTTRENAGHAAAAGLASVAIPLHLDNGKSGALTITTLLQARRQDLPGSIDVRTPFQRLDSSRLVEAIELTVPVSNDRSSTTTLGARLWGRREELELHDDPKTAKLGPSSTDDSITAAGTSIGVRGHPLARDARDGTETSFVELRVDGSGERYAPGTWVGAVAPPAATRTSTGLAFDGNMQIARILTLAGSARGDLWFDAADDGTHSNELRPTGNLGVELPIGPVILASHAGFVARPPSFEERYGNRGAFIGVPTIKTESAFTADAGARMTRRFGPLRLHVETDGFATWADDLITFVFVGAEGRSKATNIGRARLLGLESEIRASAFGFDARASHTALTTFNESACREEGVNRFTCVRPALPGRPTQDLTVDLAYEHPLTHIRVRYGIDYIAGISADEIGNTEVPARLLHSASIRSPIPGIKGLSLSLDVRNLFDLRVVDYRDILLTGGPAQAHYPVGDLYSFPLPGRNVMLSARWITP